MRLLGILTVFLLSLTAKVSAQSDNPTAAVVVFDPLFWKEELNLSDGQYLQIRNINKEYYDAIYQLANQYAGNTSRLRHLTDELLEQRSEKIWSTFHPRQKRKWRKLAEDYTNTGGQILSLVTPRTDKAQS